MKLMGLLIAGCLVTATWGCATAKMRVPDDVLTMQSEYIVATERKNASGAFVNESFKLGQYTVTDVNREWDSTKTLSVWTYSKEKKTSGYTYTFKAPAGNASGACQIEGRSNSVTSFGGVSMANSVSKIGCACQFGDKTAKAVLDSENEAQYTGTVTLRDAELRIKAIYDIEGRTMASGNPSGYRVDGDAVRAAVDVFYPGRVWLAKDLSDAQKDDLSCIFTGLMLYQGKKAKDDF